MEANGNNVQSSKNESNTPSIKIQKTRNILTALTPWKSPFKIDAEDYENIQEILRLKISDDAPLSYAVCELAAIDPYTDQYRVEGLRLRDYGDTVRSWYTQPHLPNSLCNLDALIKIEICGTQIKTLFSEDDDADYPKVIPNLRNLKLESMPRLQCLPSNIGSFSKLQKLTLTELLIDALPDSLSSLVESLKAVVITYCENLTHLPDGFGQLHSLKRFVTNKTPIEHLPDNFGNLTNLQELEMEFHHLTQLPPGFTNLTNLHTLGTGTVAFNFPVPHLPNLYYLTTSVYNIHQFAQTPNVGELDICCHCDNATEASVLDLEFSHLSTWSNLVSLAVTLFGHPFEYTLPKGLFTNFTKLKDLFLGCSKSQALGVYIDELPCLLQLNKMQLNDCVLKSIEALAHPVTLLNLNSIDLCNMKGNLELLSAIRAPCLSSIYLNDCSTLDDVTFGNLCTSWFPHLRKLHSLFARRCSIANVRPDHFQHLGETDGLFIYLEGNPIFHGSESEVERKLLPLVQHCHKGNSGARVGTDHPPPDNWSQDLQEVDHSGYHHRQRTLSWMKQLGMKYANHKKSYYVDGHEREDVAALGCNEHRPETHLVVLDSDEVFSNERWQTLHQASDKVHMTGPDTRRRTVVFSSIALLAISVWCENMSWEVCGSVDGTHGISDSSYKLITLGVNAFRKETMRRSFHPLVYIWGEGEREIVALHGFLNWKIAVRHLFGINSVCFKRGVVSDSTSVFSNSVRAAFPGSPPLSCYPHIIRKFKIGDRSGNGSYAAKVKNGGPMWLKTEAEEAIRRCSFCKTEQPMLKMWELTQKKWVMDGQEALAETFAKTYINNNDFNKWYYTASGQHGCVPCNNAMESHHLQMKGSKYFYGFMEHGADMRTCLTISFVRLVYNASVSLSSPSWGLPVLDYGRASQNDDFMKFQSLLDPKVDIKEYNDGWLINDATYLATPITEDDIAKMEMALSGKMEEDAEAHVGDRDIRDILLSRTTRFHHVKRSVWTFEKNNDVYFHCDCRDYYYTQWCFQSAYMQHREELQLLGKKITSKRSKTSNSSKRRKIIKDALKAAEERIDAQNIKNGN